ncbi:MAG: FxsA family protein [Planctomycetota bacterium]|nr:FxsA family protein [Planctomycetota bacterium]
MKIFSFLLVTFVLTTLTELYLIIEISDTIGWPRTIAWTLLTGVAGSWLARREGRKTLAEIRTDMEQMRMPTRSLIDGALILFSGGLLITPGFLTDAVGFSLLIPVTRKGYRKLLTRWFQSRFQLNKFYRNASFSEKPASGNHDPWNNIVEGEVIPDESDQNDPDIIDVDVVD